MVEATRRARDFADRYGKLYPKAVACLSESFASLTVHLRFPRQHWNRIRHSDFIEHLRRGESRRRVKVVGRLSAETSCLTLVWAVLDLLITHETNGIRFTQLDRQHASITRMTLT